MSNTLLPLGSSIGILGGGQLGRMIAMSCIELGYKSFVYCPKGDNPAVEVSSQHIIGDWNNDLLLNKFISSVDAVTIEFENIPIEVIQALENSAASSVAKPKLFKRWARKWRPNASSS